MTQQHDCNSLNPECPQCLDIMYRDGDRRTKLLCIKKTTEKYGITIDWDITVEVEIDKHSIVVVNEGKFIEYYHFPGEYFPDYEDTGDEYKNNVGWYILPIHDNKFLQEFLK